MISRQEILDVLRTIDDPEMPISIVDLGIVEGIRIESSPDDQNPERDGIAVSITILPTFIGCPALVMIREEIEAGVGRLEGVSDVEVTFVNDPPWTVDRITSVGRERLRRHGVVVPDHGARSVPAMASTDSGPSATVTLSTSVLPCPYCGSSDTHLESHFGPTRCRMIYYCNACGNPFEGMKCLKR